jgi:RNA polymerase sporulation-specific sigma factor
LQGKDRGERSEDFWADAQPKSNGIFKKREAQPLGRLSKVEISGVNTAELPVLSREEARELFLRVREGDESAREALIQGNLRLVLSVIKKFDGRSENPDDLFQVGCVGLIKGIDNFNVDMDVYPSTYLVPMIVGEIRRYLRDNSAVRVSRSMRDTAYKVLQAKEAYVAQHQKEPTVEEIAQILGIKREDVVFALDAIVDPISLYEPVYTDGGDALCVMDQVRDNKNTDESWLEQIALREAMERLSDREKRILSLRFFEGKTQMEVSARIGISQAQISRLEKNAIQKIKKDL